MSRRILTAWDVRVRLAAALGWMIALMFTRRPVSPLILSLVLVAVIALDSGMAKLMFGIDIFLEGGKA